MRVPKLQLYTKVLIALPLGILFGVCAGSLGLSDMLNTYVQPLGSAFIRLIGMVVVPLVFASLIVGSAGLGVGKLGRIGVKTIAYYLCTTLIAVCIGLVLANTLKPGAGLSEKTRRQLAERGAAETAGNIQVGQMDQTIGEILLDIIPKNPVRALADGNMLQLIFFALLFGVALAAVPPQRSRAVIDFFNGLNDAMIQIVHLVMRLAPYAVFILISATVSQLGLGILLALVKYAAVTIAGLAVHTLLVYPASLKLFTPMSANRFFTGIRPAQLIAFGSGSSSATLPITMECAQNRLGVSNEVSSFVLPLGATINMDGTALFQGVSAVFIAQVYGIDLGLGHQLTIVLTALLASIGTAGVPAAGIVMLAVVLQSAGIPLEGIAIIIGVERLLDMCRTVVNVTGDACCAVVVAATEDRLDDASSLDSAG